MREERVIPVWRARHHGVAVLCLASVSLIGVAQAQAQVGDSTPKGASPGRLLTVEEGRSIVTAAGKQSSAGRWTRDCSHLVHQIYQDAGFEYPYVSSTQMYAGNKTFARVNFPHAGDLIVWPGHMGIVADPSKHSFYSLVSTGLQPQDYQAPYWRARGRPRFYRYRVQNPIILSAKTVTSSQISTINKQHDNTTLRAERSSEQASGSDQLSRTAIERTGVIYGPTVPPELANESVLFEIPSSLLIVAGSKPPTREEVEEGISGLNDVAGNLLRSEDLLNVPMPLVIIEKFSVERVEIKRDHGWAHLQIDGKAYVAGATQLKGRREKVRWELRHTESGWEAITPSDRTYVSHDAAVKNLAAQLARLAASDGAAAHEEAVLRQESQLANLLSVLLGQD